MTYLVSAADRAAFKRCRRQWDFAAGARRRLVPERAPAMDLDRAVRDALAVYYFPGMWDWESAIVLPLVGKALVDALTRQRQAVGERDGAAGEDDARWADLLDRGQLLLDRYFTWAPTVDHLSPIRVETDFEAIVTDPADDSSGLLAPDGGGISYTGRVDLLAIDEHDRYWVVRHRVVDGPLPPTEQLMLEEEAVAACWAWERFYDGMEVAGTMYNELSATAGALPGERRRSWDDHERGGIAQNEGSGGGRGVSSLRRMYVPGRPSEPSERVWQRADAGFRRTVIRRDRAEVRAAGLRLAQESLDMVAPDLRTYPSPAPESCSDCAFVAPCLAVDAGGDVEAVLSAGYRQRPAVEVELGRLGGSPQGVGRGWVPGRRPD